MPKYKRSPTIHTTPFLHRTARAPSARRLKFFTVLFALGLVIFLLYRSTTTAQEDALGDFYYKTKTALDNDKEDHTKHASSSSREHDHDHGSAKDDNEDLEMTKKMTQRLKDAAKEAKDKANAKSPKPDPPSSIIGVGSSAEGTEKGLGRGKKGSDGTQKVVKEEKETEEDHEVEVELNKILKKSPVIIFSKSYCPHSARAKTILLEKYILDPPPFVVELDKHPLGLNLQSRLEELTKRRTVPNILVNGVSIGGGDDVAALDEEKKLVDKIKEIAGKKMVEVRLKAGSNKERENEKSKKGPVRGSDGSV